jgi:hypothetical protein
MSTAQADGRSVGVYLGGREYSDTNGAGTTRSFNLSFPEGKKLRFNICLQDRGWDAEDGTCAYSTVRA